MSSKKPVHPLKTPPGSGYPARQRDGDAALDPSRRRFMRQLAGGAGAAGLLSTFGLPRLAHGQSMEVNFSLLDAHPSTHDLMSPASGDMTAAPAAPAEPAAAAPPPPAAPPSDSVAGAGVTQVTENRALFVDPGYLFLIRWTRPADNADVVAALEGSAQAVQSYLGEHVSTADDLHDLGRLHAIEMGVVELLSSRVAPANVETLHLDHDCNTVCSSLGWEVDPDFIPLPGIAPPPSWE